MTEDRSAKPGAESRNTTELASILERISDAFVAFDRDLRYTYVNPKAGELFGRSPESLLGKLYLDEYPEAEGSPFHLAYVRALEEQLPVIFEDYYEPWDRWFENRVYPSEDGLAIFFTEITERRLVERELKRRNVELTALHETSLRLIEQRDTASVLEEIATRGARLVRSPYAYIYVVDPGGETLTATVALGEAARYQGVSIQRSEGVAGRVVQTGKPLIVHDYTSWPGRVGYFDDAGIHCVAAVPLHSGANVIGVLGVAHLEEGLRFSDDDLDLLERFAHLASLTLASARLNEELETSLARLQLATETARIGVWEFDVSTGVTQDEVVDEWLGVEPGESINSLEEFLQVVHVDDRDRIRAAVEEALEGAAPYAEELRIVGLSGEIRWFSSAGTVIRDDDGMPVRMLGASIDITAAKTTEEELRHLTVDLEQRVMERTRDVEIARTEAERANAAKSDFLSRMSHELRTPLNAMLGFARLLELDGLGPEQSDSVQQILKAGRHLLELVEELLDVSKIEAGALDLLLEPVEVAGVLQEAIRLMRPLAANHGIDLRTAHEESPDLWVLADRQRLLQILLNLFSNAIQYSGRGGSVEAVYTAVEKDRVRFDVCDTGCGIAEKDLERLFVPFERLESASDVAGTGLGLSLAKSLVEAMGGSIGVESSLGEGSRFFFELPAVDAPGSDPLVLGGTPLAAIEPSAVTRTILLIEDDLSSANLVELIVGRVPGARLLTATCGGDGLQIALVERPDLILLDLALPDVSGDEVLRRLRAEPATAEISVVVVSADASRESIEHLLAAGALDYMTKPIDVERLLARISTA